MKEWQKLFIKDFGRCSCGQELVGHVESPRSPQQGDPVMCTGAGSHNGACMNFGVISSSGDSKDITWLYHPPFLSLHCPAYYTTEKELIVTTPELFGTRASIAEIVAVCSPGIFLYKLQFNLETKIKTNDPYTTTEFDMLFSTLTTRGMMLTNMNFVPATMSSIFERLSSFRECVLLRVPNKASIILPGNQDFTHAFDSICIMFNCTEKEIHSIICNSFAIAYNIIMNGDRTYGPPFLYTGDKS